MVDHHNWQELVDQLRGTEYQFGVVTPNTPVHRIEFDKGLSDLEISATESRFGFRFPPDLRDFLQNALPRGPRFPDWRNDDELTLRDRLDLPRRGVLFDVEHNGFWLDEWGPRPSSLEKALRLTDQLLETAPTLIPVFGHRMIPDEPHLPGNPVFSVHQTDIIYYGFDLHDYLRHEFNLTRFETRPERMRKIRFRGQQEETWYGRVPCGETAERPVL